MAGHYERRGRMRVWVSDDPPVTYTPPVRHYTQTSSSYEDDSIIRSVISVILSGILMLAAITVYLVPSVLLPFVQSTAITVIVIFLAVSLIVLRLVANTTWGKWISTIMLAVAIILILYTNSVFNTRIGNVYISTAKQLNYIRNHPSCNYMLTADIDMSGTKWEAVKGFTGSLDGCGFSINNLTLKSGSNMALIGDGKGTVKNLIIKNISASVTSPEGKIIRLAGIYANPKKGAVIQNCYAEGALNADLSNNKAEVYIGSIAGESYGSISDSYSAVDIEAVLNCYSASEGHIGGVAGISFDAISDCTSTGVINVTYTQAYSADWYLCVGGIAGSGQGGSVTDCLTVSPIYTSVGKTCSDGSIFFSYTTNGYIGGILGYADAASITNCCSNGSIIFDAKTQSRFSIDIGGILGKSSSGSLSLSNCFFRGSISSVGNAVTLKTAGIYPNNTSSMSNCYYGDNVSYDSTYGASEMDPSEMYTESFLFGTLGLSRDIWRLNISPELIKSCGEETVKKNIPRTIASTGTYVLKSHKDGTFFRPEKNVYYSEELDTGYTEYKIMHLFAKLTTMIIVLAILIIILVFMILDEGFDLDLVFSFKFISVTSLTLVVAALLVFHIVGTANPRAFGKLYDGLFPDSSYTQTPADENEAYYVYSADTPDGGTYTGYMLKGIPHGEGTYTYTSGAVYVGELNGWKRQGQGVMTYSDGTYYDGHWEDDYIDGAGTFVSSQGTYTGDWVKSNRCGYGVYTMANGDVYEGMWSDNLMNGQGTYRCSDGRVLSGTFVNGEFTGD